MNPRRGRDPGMVDLLLLVTPLGILFFNALEMN